MNKAKVAIMIEMLQMELTKQTKISPNDTTLHMLMNDISRLEAELDLPNMNEPYPQSPQPAPDHPPRTAEFDLLCLKVIDWADKRNIFETSTPLTQWVKTVSEVAEMGEAIAKGDNNLIEDAVGDILVTIIIACHIIEISPTRCLHLAYEEIKNRKGKMVGGIFVKDE